jgi:signal transduction histidine kinase
VTDEGVGHIDNVEMFAPFHRGGDETTAAVAGTGLGLYIVRTLVEAMGGTVTARANQDRGSTFTIRLPAAP